MLSNLVHFQYFLFTKFAAVKSTVIKASWFHPVTRAATPTIWVVSGVQLTTTMTIISTRLIWPTWKLNQTWSVDGTTCQSHLVMGSDASCFAVVKYLSWKWRDRARLKSNLHRTRARHFAGSSSTMSVFPMLATIVAMKHFHYGRACLLARNFRPITRPWLTVSICWRRKRLMKCRFWSIKWTCRKGIGIF